MTEADHASAGSGAEGLAPGVSAGALLQQAREAAGMHISTLAVMLKVPVNRLEALESNHFELLPDAVFARALAASACRALHTEAAPILALLPQSTAPRLVPEHDRLNAPLRNPAARPWPALGRQLTRPGVILILLLLLGAAVLALLPGVQRDTVKATPSTPTVVTEPPLPAIAPPALPAPVASSGAESGVVLATPAPLDVVALGPAAPPVLAASGATGVPPVASSPVTLLPPASALLPTPVTAAVKTAAAAASAPMLPASSPRLPASVPRLPASAANSGLLVFEAQGETWIEVTDARGISVLRRTLNTGESASVSGALPLAVVVGRIDVTRLQVRGKPFDLKGVGRDNVARFEIKQ